MNLIFSENSGTYIARRINLFSPSLYMYRLPSGTLDLPLFHGGNVEVDGDVSFDSVVDLLSSYKTSNYTTEIDVSGSLVGCNQESVKLAMKHLREAICENSDDDLFIFSICGSVYFENDTDSTFENIQVRKWTISFSSMFSSSTRWCLKCIKTF